MPTRHGFAAGFIGEGFGVRIASQRTASALSPAASARSRSCLARRGLSCRWRSRTPAAASAAVRGDIAGERQVGVRRGIAANCCRFRSQVGSSHLTNSPVRGRFRRGRRPGPRVPADRREGPAGRPEAAVGSSPREPDSLRCDHPEPRQVAPLVRFIGKDFSVRVSITTCSRLMAATTNRPSGANRARSGWNFRPGGGSSRCQVRVS